MSKQRFSALIIRNISIVDYNAIVSKSQFQDGSFVFRLSVFKNLTRNFNRSIYSTSEQMHQDIRKDMLFKLKSNTYEYPVIGCQIGSKIFTERETDLILFAPYVRILNRICTQLQQRGYNSYVRFDLDSIINDVKGDKIYNITINKVGFATQSGEVLLKANMSGKTVLESDMYNIFIDQKLGEPIEIRLNKKSNSAELSIDRFGNIWVNLKYTEEDKDFTSIEQYIEMVEVATKNILPTNIRPLRHKNENGDNEND